MSERRAAVSLPADDSQHAPFHCDSGAYVDVSVVLDAVFNIGGVQVWEIAQRQGGGFHHHVVDGNFGIRREGIVELSSQCQGIVHGHRIGDVEMGDRLLAAAHALGNRPPEGRRCAPGSF